MARLLDIDRSELLQQPVQHAQPLLGDRERALRECELLGEADLPSCMLQLDARFFSG